MNALFGQRMMEILRIGVDGDEVHPPDLGIDHVVDRVFAGTADAEDFYSSESFNVWGDVGHGFMVWNESDDKWFRRQPN